MAQITPLEVSFHVDAATYPGARDQMVKAMQTMCPGMPFEWTVTCGPSGAQPQWRFQFSVRFAVAGRQEAT